MAWTECGHDSWYTQLGVTYIFKARCFIEFEGAVNKKYYSVQQISRIQYKLTIYCVRWNNYTALPGDDRVYAKEGFLPKQAAAKPQIISHQTF